MEKEKSDRLIADAAKTLFSYCRARTNSKEEAEDLSQDIILELLRTRENLRDDKAFYGFMWAVAGNVYKEWCKKRRKNVEGELDETLPDGSVPLDELLEKESDLRLLYRELGLLTEQYRKVIIQYYFNAVKVSDISKSLGISESMVKFLLFKSRKILKEGMNMERTRGELSFNPSKMGLMFSRRGVGSGKPEDAHSFWNLFRADLIPQNILLACYNDRCTAEEISLQMGVAVPYLESDLKKLCEKELLIHKGGKYEAAIIIFTKEFSKETDEKTLPIQHDIARIIEKCFNERLNDIKAIGFHRGIEDDNFLKWLITHIIFREAVIKYSDSLNPTPKKYAGTEAFICGDEFYPNHSGRFVNTGQCNANGDFVMCMDFSVITTEPDCFYFDRYPNRTNIVLDIARGKSTGFSENDMSEIAEFIKRGFVKKTGDELNLNLTVFTKEQFEKLKIMIDDVINYVIDKTRENVNIVTDILIQHTPVSLKKEAENISWLKLGDCITAPVKIMADNGTLQRVSENAHPTTYIVLA